VRKGAQSIPHPLPITQALGFFTSYYRSSMPRILGRSDGVLHGSKTPWAYGYPPMHSSGATFSRSSSTTAHSRESACVKTQQTTTTTTAKTSTLTKTNPTSSLSTLVQKLEEYEESLREEARESPPPTTSTMPLNGDDWGHFVDIDG